MIRVVALLVCLATPVMAQVGRDPADAIGAIERDLDAIRAIIAGWDDAPEGPIPFLTDRRDLQRDLDRRLDRLLDLVLGSRYGEARDRLLSLDRAEAALRERAAQARVERLTAAPGSGEPTLLDRAMGRMAAPGSQDALDREIASLEDRIESAGIERSELINDFRRHVEAEWGLALDGPAAEALLYRADGGTLLEAATLFAAIARIEDRLREIERVAGDERTMRRYYAVAAVTRLMLVRLHERHLADYDTRWLPRLAEIEGRNARLISETEGALLETEAPARRAAFEGNLAVQRRVAEVIADYRAALVERRDEVRRRLAVAQADAAVALNTLKTLEAATALSADILRSGTDWQVIGSLAVPDLVPLDPDSFEAFREVSRSLSPGA